MRRLHQICAARGGGIHISGGHISGHRPWKWHRYAGFHIRSEINRSQLCYGLNGIRSGRIARDEVLEEIRQINETIGSQIGESIPDLGKRIPVVAREVAALIKLPE